ncbi:hypothetical protein Cabys_1177 [Caldithrix abyssi DSM 13497]|uniref:Uncharacterized protein n=1 Tax=Caldithrix abyssi DSM 13497 TaxID=880073 RepID=A0A1J1C5T7_CALAY|nr:hypothetical protein Cabys_1177 [Caldithrix abyssi DSM 13497]
MICGYPLHTALLICFFNAIVPLTSMHLFFNDRHRPTNYENIIFPA